MQLMHRINRTLPILMLLVISGCGIFREAPDSDPIPEGKYRSTVFNSGKVYVENRVDTVVVYRLRKEKREFVADTTAPFFKVYPQRLGHKEGTCVFNRVSFDFDALTIPFKYRPETRSLPQQFTTSLNGAIFLGLRSDSYRLRYRKNFFNYYESSTGHYAIALGGFTGFGSTAMNPWVTDNNISSEYEGVVWSKGAALIMGVGRYTSGISIGWDNLFDKNRKFWIYEKKPWIGLVFGLNLN